MKSSYSRCRKLYYTEDSFIAQQKVLLQVESFIAQQKALLHSKKFYYATEDFIAQQKVLPHNRKVSTVAKLEKSSFCGRNKNKPTLQRLPLDLDSTFAHKLATAEWYFGAHSTEHQT